MTRPAFHPVGPLRPGPDADPPHVRAWRAELLRACAAPYLDAAGELSILRLRRGYPVTRHLSQQLTINWRQFTDPNGLPLSVHAGFPPYAAPRLVVWLDAADLPPGYPLNAESPVLAASLPTALTPCTRADAWPFIVPWVLRPAWLVPVPAPASASRRAMVRGCH